MSEMCIRDRNNHEELLGGAPEATSNKQTVEDNLLGRPHVAEKSFAPEAKKDALAPKTPEERFAELQRLTSVYLSCLLYTSRCV